MAPAARPAARPTVGVLDDQAVRSRYAEQLGGAQIALRIRFAAGDVFDGDQDDGG